MVSIEIFTWPSSFAPARVDRSECKLSHIRNSAAWLWPWQRADRSGVRVNSQAVASTEYVEARGCVRCLFGEHAVSIFLRNAGSGTRLSSGGCPFDSA